MGALISEEHLQKVIGFMDIAKKEVLFRGIVVFYIVSLKTKRKHISISLKTKMKT